MSGGIVIDTWPPHLQLPFYGSNTWWCHLLHKLFSFPPPDEREGQMSHVSSSDSLNGRRTSSDSGKDSEGASGLSAPSEAAGIIRVSPDRRGSGPGPAVPPRKRSDLERRSCSSLSEKEMSESQISNGCSSR